MGFIEFFADLLSAFGNFQPSGTKPRRVFTRRFVAFCVMVTVLELMTLNHFYSGR